jgi:hypothetical protein
MSFTMMNLIVTLSIKDTHRVFMLSFVMLNVIMLSVVCFVVMASEIMLCAIILNVFMLNVVILNVFMLSVMAPLCFATVFILILALFRWVKVIKHF